MATQAPTYAPSNYSLAYGGSPNLPSSTDIMDMISKMMGKAAPGLSGNINKATENAGNLLSGRISPDVANQMKDSKNGNA